jgi:hypothetical protein
VQGRDKDGLITISTDRGQIRIATNANLPPGANVTLEVRSAGDRLQVVVLAIDQTPPPISPNVPQSGAPAQGLTGPSNADGQTEATSAGGAHDPAMRGSAQIAGDKAEPAPTVIVAGTRLTAIVIQSVPRDLLHNPATGAPLSGTTSLAPTVPQPPIDAGNAARPNATSTFSADFLQTEPPPISASLIPEIHDRITALFAQPPVDAGANLPAQPAAVSGFALSPEIRDRIIALFVGPVTDEEPTTIGNSAASPVPPAPPANARPQSDGNRPTPPLPPPAVGVASAIPGQTAPAPDVGAPPATAPLPARPAEIPGGQGNQPLPAALQASTGAPGRVPQPATSQGPIPPAPPTAAASQPMPTGTTSPLPGTTPPTNPPTVGTGPVTSPAVPLASAASTVPNATAGASPAPGTTPPGVGNTAPGTTIGDPQAFVAPRSSAASQTASALGIATQLQSPAAIAAAPTPPMTSSRPASPLPPAPDTGQSPAATPNAGTAPAARQPTVQQSLAPNNPPPLQPTGVNTATAPQALPPQPTNQASTSQQTGQPALPTSTLASTTASIPGPSNAPAVPTTPASAAPTPPAAPPPLPANAAQLPPTSAPATGDPAAANNQVAASQQAAPQGSVQPPITANHGADTQSPNIQPAPGNTPANLSLPPALTPALTPAAPLPQQQQVPPQQVQIQPQPASGNPPLTVPPTTPVPTPSVGGGGQPVRSSGPQVGANVPAQPAADVPAAPTSGHPTLPAQILPGAAPSPTAILPILTGGETDTPHPILGPGAQAPGLITPETVTPGLIIAGPIIAGPIIAGATTASPVTSGPVAPRSALPIQTLPGMAGTVVPSPAAPLPTAIPVNPSTPAAATQDSAVSPSPIPPVGLTPLVTNLTTAASGDTGNQSAVKTGTAAMPAGAKAAETSGTTTATAAENKAVGVAVTAIVSSLGKQGQSAPAIAAANAEYLATNLAVSGANEEGLAKLDLAGKEQLATPLPTGTEVRLRVINIQTQPSSPGLPGAATQLPGAMSAGKGTILGQILGHTPAGHPVIHTAIGDLVLQQQASLPVGGEITLALEAVEMAASSGSQLLPATPQMTAINLAQGWPTLLDLLVTLQKGLAAGTEAGGTTADTPDPAALARLPQTGSKLAAGLNAAVDAFRGGDFEKLFGPLTSALKSTGGKQEAIRKLRDEFGQLSMLAQDRPNQDWKCFMLPVWDDGRLQQINLFYRRPRRNQGGKDKKDEATRFVVDVNFTRLGGCQLDGLIRKKNFDLMVRSHQELPLSIKRDIAGLFAQARDIGNYAGEVSFQTALRFPVSPLDDIAEGPPSVTA